MIRTTPIAPAENLLIPLRRFFLRPEEPHGLLGL